MTRHHVVLTSALAGLAGMLLTAAPARAGGATLKGTVSFSRGKANLVVYVEKAPGQFHPGAHHPLIDQKRMEFIPHVLPVVLGTTVDFMNSDKVAHNVFSPDHEGYNLGSWKKGERRSYTFKHLGTYTQLCSIHPEMEAFVVVVQNPYFAVTDGDGHFTIDGIPPGHYVLKVWGEKLHSKDKKKTFQVDVPAAGATTTITF